MIEKQLKEAEKLGFKKCIIPENNKKLLKEKLKLDIIGVKNIKEAMKQTRITIKSIAKSDTKEEEITLKSERGITLVVLVITVIIMAILVSTGVRYGISSYDKVKLQNFSYELQQIQGRVDSVSQKMKMDESSYFIYLDGKTMGVNVGASKAALDTLKKVKRIDYVGASSSDKDLYPLTGEAIYRYYSVRSLEEDLDIKNASQDVIINFKTREVISVNGINFEGKIYYRLKDL